MGLNDEKQKSEEEAAAAALKEAAAKRAAEIQAKIDSLNEHATAAQKIARQAAVQATHDATVANNQALAAEAAAKHAKKVEAEQKEIVKEKTADAAKKKAEAAASQAKADKLNAVAGAAVKKLNDEKKTAQEAAAAAAIKAKAEEAVVAAKKKEAAEIRAEADKAEASAKKKKEEAESMVEKIKNADCKKHPGCKGLAGYCCPTLNFNQMHLGSVKLAGAKLGCCNSATEIEDETALELGSEAPHSNSIELQPFELFTSIIFAFVAGSVLTGMVSKFSATRAGNRAEYQSLAAA